MTTWIPVGAVIAFLLFGWLRLLYGAATKNRRIAELKAYADSYGQKLTDHHDSKGACEEAAEAWRAKHKAQAVRIGELATQASDQGEKLVDAEVFRKTVVDFIVSGLTGTSTAGRLFGRHLQSELDLAGCSVDADVKASLPLTAESSP